VPEGWPLFTLKPHTGHDPESVLSTLIIARTFDFNPLYFITHDTHINICYVTCAAQGPAEASKCPLSISLNSCTRLLKLAALFRCRHKYGVSPGDGVSRPWLERDKINWALYIIIYLYTMENVIYTVNGNDVFTYKSSLQLEPLHRNLTMKKKISQYMVNIILFSEVYLYLIKHKTMKLVPRHNSHAT
jgi:hypothetical protein